MTSSALARIVSGTVKRRRGLQVDHQLECRWLLNREIRRLLSLLDPSGVSPDLAPHTREAGSIADQAACHDRLAPFVHAGTA